MENRFLYSCIFSHYHTVCRFHAIFIAISEGTLENSPFDGENICLEYPGSQFSGRHGYGDLCQRRMGWQNSVYTSEQPMVLFYLSGLDTRAP